MMKVTDAIKESVYLLCRVHQDHQETQELKAHRVLK